MIFINIKIVGKRVPFCSTVSVETSSGSLYYNGCVMKLKFNDISLFNMKNYSERRQPAVNLYQIICRRDIDLFFDIAINIKVKFF